MTQYSIELKAKEYVRGYGFLLFARNLYDKYGKQLFNIATKTGPDTLKLITKK